MAKIKLLSVRQVDHLPAGFHSDGANLYLRVRDTGSRSWVFRYRLAGKTVEIGLGPVSGRSLQQARELAGRMRTALAGGEDPASLVRVKPDGAAMTFSECARELIAAKRSGWRNAKHAAQWPSTLEAYAYPVIGGKLPADVSLADVKAILQPLWASKTETATRLRQRIEAVLDYAAVHDDDQNRSNPARWKGVLDKVLPPARKVTKRRHHPAAPYADVPGIMAALRGRNFVTSYCLRFTILTAARSGEARGALWGEVDIENRIWALPARRMKADKPHRVPLCDEAMLILDTMRQWRHNGCALIFPGARGGLLSDVGVNKALRAIALGVTVHGFRSSFRDWGAETTAFPSAVLELALAHVNRDKVEAAYQRSDLFERRRELMDAWGGYCSGRRHVIKLAAASGAAR